MDNLLANRQAKLVYYAPYNFIRSITTEAHIVNWILPKIDTLTKHTSTHANTLVDIYYEKLEWDTNYFNIPTYKLNYILFNQNNIAAVKQSVSDFVNTFNNNDYIICEVPSEDIDVIQALTQNGFSLIETRLTYYNNNLANFNEKRHSIRAANLDDTQNLMRVAMEMKNDYDRFHADNIFSTEQADNFLATYIQQSLKGFADVVLTSNESGLPSDSFLTANYLKHEWTKTQVPVSKMVLSAVSSQTNKGWYKKLISEMTYHLMEQGAQYIFMNTQSTNRAVYHTWEQLGYKLGGVTHVFSKKITR